MSRATENKRGTNTSANGVRASARENPVGYLIGHVEERIGKLAVQRSVLLQQAEEIRADHGALGGREVLWGEYPGQHHAEHADV